MDNTDDRTPQQGPRADDRQEAGGASQPQAFAEMQRQLAELAAAVDRHREQMRDHEKSLVERIADVDDDRRGTTTKLQRAWQTQGEQLEGRLRRQARVTAGALLLLGLLVAGALLLLDRQGGSERLRLVNDIAEIKLQLDRTSRIGALDDRVAGDLTQLSSAVGKIYSSLEGIKQEQERNVEQALGGERAAREEADTGIVKEIRRLEADQQGFAQRLDSLHEALQDAKAQAAPAANAAGGEPAPGAGGTPGGGAVAPEQGPPAATVGTDAGVPETGSDATTGAGEAAPASSATDRIVTADRRYALQMISFSGLQGLRRFARREGLPPQVYYLAETYKGRPVYAVIHSLYADQAAATEALSNLPAGLRELDPWVRSLPLGAELRILKPAPGD